MSSLASGYQAPHVIPSIQILTIRAVHEKLHRLLPPCRQPLLSGRAFQPFSGLRPLLYNSYTEVREQQVPLLLGEIPLTALLGSPSSVHFPAELNWVFYVFANRPFQPLWKAAILQFDRSIAPAEQEAASKLKAWIGDAQDSPQQVPSTLQSHLYLYFLSGARAHMQKCLFIATGRVLVLVSL